MGKGWVHQSQSLTYLRSIFVEKYFSLFKRNVYGARLTIPLGIGRFSVPFIAEYITSTHEPTLVSERGLKIVFWDKVMNSPDEKRVEARSGWIQAKWMFDQKRPPTAYIDLRGHTLDNYFEDWGHTLKNHRNKWLSQLNKKMITLEEVDVQTFHNFYAQSSLRKRLRKFYGKQMFDFAQAYQKNIHFYLIKNEVEEVVAGTCIVDDLETEQSIYQYVFTDKANKYKYIGVGIIDLCIQHTFEQGFSFLNLTAVWEKGQPNSWKGLSKFKDQFHPTISYCRNTYLKFTFKI